MSDNIPFEIQVEIMKCLNVKSLIQFRSVSKAWKSVIDSSHFIARYCGQQQHLLVSYNQNPLDADGTYVSVVDDDSFPQQKVSVTNSLLLEHSCIIGSSHGLLCLYSRYHCIDASMAVIWNPTIRKAVAVVVPDRVMLETVVGFGVCRETIDPKIVKIAYTDSWLDLENASDIAWQVEVFTLSTTTWRSLYSNLQRKSIQFYYFQVVVDGVLYWLAIHRITLDDEFESYKHLIVSFDMTSEEFNEVNLPDSLAQVSICQLSISQIRESLVMFDVNTKSVWMMEDGVSKSFTKLFTVSVDMPLARVMGFRKSGEPIIKIYEPRRRIYKLVIYEPYSRHVDDVGIHGLNFSFRVYPYKETLLLHNQPNHMVYDEMNTLRLPSSFV